MRNDTTEVPPHFFGFYTLCGRQIFRAIRITYKGQGPSWLIGCFVKLCQKASNTETPETSSVYVLQTQTKRVLLRTHTASQVTSGYI